MIITIDRRIDKDHLMLILRDEHGGGHQAGGPVSQPPSSRLCFCGVCRCLPGRLALSRCLYPYQRRGCLSGENPLPLPPPRVGFCFEAGAGFSEKKITYLLVLWV